LQNTIRIYAKSYSEYVYTAAVKEIGMV